MVRLSKQTRRRQKSHKRPKAPAVKTGPLKETLENGYKEHVNALTGDLSKKAYIPRIK